MKSPLCQHRQMEARGWKLQQAGKQNSLDGSKGLIDSRIYIKVDGGLEWSASVLTLSLPSDSINGLDKDLIEPLVKFADQSSGWG